MKLSDLLNEYAHEDDTINTEESSCGLKDILKPFHICENYFWDNCGAPCCAQCFDDEFAKNDKICKFVFVMILYFSALDIIGAIVMLILKIAGVF